MIDVGERQRVFFDTLQPAPSSGEAAPIRSYIPADSPLNWSEQLETLHADDDHFIDVLTRRSVLDALRDGGLEKAAVVADVGCSSGKLLRDLAEAAPGAVIAGVDALRPALERAREVVPDATLFHASATDLPFGDGTLDVLTALNVLEHLRDDDGALREFCRVLRPGGRAVIVVPWNPRLYDTYDALLQHERRYGRGELRRKAAQAGLRRVTTRYLGSLVYPGFWAVKSYGRLRHGRGAGGRSEAVVARRIAATRASRLARTACGLETRLVRAGVRLPFGIRELTVFERA